jgi:hypothetical protein
MTQRLGYLVDLSTVRLDEATSSSWIQAMPLGEYEHPVYGTIRIDQERVQRFAQNVQANVRGQELDIDYDHKAKRDDAAGWVKNAEARPDGLWVLVEWTKEAFGKLKDKAYRYFSPEFVDEWEHPSTKQKFDDVLFGGGLTNRPFLKGILPINMSELGLESGEPPAEGGSMTKEQKALLGLPEDATDEQVNAKLGELVKPPETVEPPKPVEPEKVPVPVAASEGLSDVLKLAEGHQDPVVKGLAEYIKQQDTKLAEQGASLRLAETTVKVRQLNETAKTKKFAFPPVVTDALTEALVALPKSLGEKVYGAFEALAKTGVVQLGETDVTPGERGDAGDAVKRFTDAANALAQKESLSFADAASKVAASDPQLFSEYAEASYSGRE